MNRLKDDNPASTAPPGDLDGILDLANRVQSKRERLKCIGRKHKEFSHTVPHRGSFFPQKSHAVAPLSKLSAMQGRSFTSIQRPKKSERDKILYGKLAAVSTADCTTPIPVSPYSETLPAFSENNLHFVDEDLSSPGGEETRGGAPNGGARYTTSLSSPDVPKDTNRPCWWDRMRNGSKLVGAPAGDGVFKTSLSSPTYAHDPPQHHGCYCDVQEKRTFFLSLSFALLALGVIVALVVAQFDKATVSKGGDDQNATTAASASNTMPACFQTRQELDSAVLGYLEDPSTNSSVARKYGFPIGTWCVSAITNFNGIFSSQNKDHTQEQKALYEKFDEPLDGWDMSSARNFERMFLGALSFNQDLYKWDTSNVQHMTAMFANTMSFNGKIDTWNTSQVQSMDLMFKKATAFNQDISGWDMSSVSKMGGVLAGASNFDQDLCPWQDSLLSKRGSDINLNLTNLFSFSHGPMSSTLQLFSDSACPDPSIPAYLNGQFLGPFCHACS